MAIKGFTGTSVIEFPERISSVVFIGGCNLRCPFCHNPELVLPELLSQSQDLSEDYIVNELKRRDGFIDGVSFTGGEPLMYQNLPHLLKRIKNELNLKIKIDTNGTNPATLKKVLPFVDYMAMDIKSSPAKYPIATGVKINFGKIIESIEIIKKIKDCEFRTTVVPEIVDIYDIQEICNIIKGAKRYVLQKYRNNKTLSSKFGNVQPYQKGYLEDISEKIQDCAEIVVLR